MTQQRDEDGPAQFDVVDRILALLECVGTAERPPTLSELARETGMPLSTAHRLLAALVSKGAVERRDRHYLPGPRMPWMAAGRALAGDGGGGQSARPISPTISAGQGCPPRWPSCMDARCGTSRRGRPTRIPPPRSTAPGSHPRRRRRQDGCCWRSPRRASWRRTTTRRGPNGVARSPRPEQELVRIRREGVAIATLNVSRGIVEIAAPVRARGGRVIAAVSTAACVGHIQPAVAAGQIKRAAGCLSAPYSASIELAGRAAGMPR
jgi:IclR helix-turn-helix domain/Bacterial transcriptional regulator